MTDQKPAKSSRSRRSSKSSSKKPVDKPVVEPKAKEKVEAPKKEEPLEVQAPDTTQKLEPATKLPENPGHPEVNVPKEDTGWVPTQHGIVQDLYGGARLKKRLRTRRSRYE